MGASGNFTSMMQTIASNFSGFQSLLMVVAYFVGFVFVVMGVIRLARHHRYVAAGDSVVSWIFPMVAGGLLLSLTFTMQSLSTSVFSTPSGLRTAMSYSSPGGSQASAMFTVLVGFITLFGWYAIIHALVILATMANANVVRNGGLKRVLVFLVAGVICSNFVYFSHILANSFGVQDFLLNYVH